MTVVNTEDGLGLSPRVRGSPNRPALWRRRHRSIPAGAGEPHSGACRRSLARVYPRGCGGAKDVLIISSPLNGLSPRVRGSPADGEVRFTFGRSIPAGAGEPLRRKATQE